MHLPLVPGPREAHAGSMTQTSFLGDQSVGRIGFGAMQLAGPGVFGPPRDREAALAVLRRAIELGVDHIDTAQFYGPNVVNELIAEALHPYPETLTLVTKVGGRRDDQGGWLPVHSPEDLREDVEANLRTLKIDRIDLVNMRLMDPGEHPREVPLADQLGALQQLKDEGKIAMIGVSNVTEAELREAIDLVDIAQVQNEYSVANRKGEPILDLARQHGIAFVPYFPLGSAFVGGPAALAADPAIAAVASKHGITPSQVALAWLLAHYDRMLLIPGTSSVAHLEENMTVGDIQLDADDLERLEGVTDLGSPMASRAHA